MRMSEMWKSAETLIPFFTWHFRSYCGFAERRDQNRVQPRESILIFLRHRGKNVTRQCTLRESGFSAKIFRPWCDEVLSFKVAQLRKSDGWLEESQTRAFNLESRNALDLAHYTRLVCARRICVRVRLCVCARLTTSKLETVVLS